MPTFDEINFVFSSAVPKEVRTQLRETFRRVNQHDELYFENCQENWP